jgi:hypothetical protein
MLIVDLLLSIFRLSPEPPPPPPMSDLPPLREDRMMLRVISAFERSKSDLPGNRLRPH